VLQLAVTAMAGSAATRGVAARPTALLRWPATLLALANAALQRFCFFFFFFNDYWQVQESSTSCSTCEKERNREQEITKDNFETCFGFFFPSSFAFV
jgi:hypothetical protein